MFKNVATKIAVFAFDTTTGAPKTGDAANITAYVSKDYGSVTALADTSATEMDATNAKGWYLFDVAQGETNADALLFSGKSSTANVSIVGQLIFTTPNRFSSLVIDASGLADATAVKVGPSGSATAQTAGDIPARLPAALTAGGNIKADTLFLNGVDLSAAGAVPMLSIVDQGTAQSATGTTLVLRAAAAFADSELVGAVVQIVSATTGAGQSRVITANVGSTDTVTVDTWTTTPTGTIVYKIWAGAPVSTAVPPPSNVTQIAGAAVNTSSAQLGVNVVQAAGTAWNSGAIDRATFSAASGQQTIRSNTAQAGAAGSLTMDASASAVTDFYKNDLLFLTGGTGVGQARYITGYNGTTKVATVNSNWATTPDNTTTFAIFPADAIVGASAPTAAQVATAVWQDTTAGDFTVSGSIGKSLFTSGAVPGAAGGLFIAGSNAATTANITGNITGNLSGSVGSVTGAVGSVTGAVGSVTGNVGGNVVGSVASVTGAVGSVTGNVGGNVTGSVGSVATGGITAGSFAAGAIDAAAIATDAIGSAELAASAVTKIQTGLSTLDAAAVRTAVGLASANLDTQLAAIQADSPNRVTKNVALAGFTFVMVDSTDHVTPKTGLTVSATRSLDGAAFAACANSVVEVSNGIYKIDLAAADTNGNTVMLRFTATGADDRQILMVTQPT